MLYSKLNLLILSPFVKMLSLGQTQLLVQTSRPLSWIIAPSIYFAGFIHSGTFPRNIPALLFAVGLTFPTCLGMLAKLT